VPAYLHRGRRPQIDPTAYVAPTAVLCGDVRIAAGARILFGAVLTAEDGQVTIGPHCIVMENSLIRGRQGHPAELGSDVLVGPHAHVNGASIGDGGFIATGASLFPGARLGPRSEVRINSVVHVNTVLPADSVVPIGWVAVGDPGQIFSPDRHDDIWAILRPLDFPQTVYGVSRQTPAADRMARQTAWFAAHQHDTPATN
jgi:carbonic anhydrase/acetyltransferase-like protein (isoleucine patch superfamily)